MSQTTIASVPPLGALCVAAGLVSQADLDACLMLQQQTDDGTPIGQILLLHNYLSTRDLARMVKHQEHVRRMHYAMANESFAPTGQSNGHSDVDSRAATATPEPNDQANRYPHRRAHADRQASADSGAAEM